MGSKYDPTKEPSARRVERAIAHFGEGYFDQPRPRAMAYLVATGESLVDAYLATIATEGAKRESARAQASMIGAHPEFRAATVAAALPPAKLTQALVPKALEVLAQNMGDASAAVRQKAADSVLDRGGVPRRSETATTIAQDIRVSGQALLQMAAELQPPPAPVIEAEPVPAAIEERAREPEQPSA